MDLKVVKESFFEIPISSLILRSYWLLGSPCCVTTLLYTAVVYILQINLTKQGEVGLIFVFRFLFFAFRFSYFEYQNSIFRPIRMSK